MYFAICALRTRLWIWEIIQVIEIVQRNLHVRECLCFDEEPSYGGESYASLVELTTDDGIGIVDCVAVSTYFFHDSSRGEIKVVYQVDETTISMNMNKVEDNYDAILRP